MVKGHSRNELTQSAGKNKSAITITPLKKSGEEKICQRRPKSAEKTSMRAKRIQKSFA